MDKVILKDFEVLACHGVNPEEKNEKQRFVFTAKLSIDISEAAEQDDVNKTVSYADVKKEINAFCEGNCFDLIETLAARLAESILKKFSPVREIELTVKKPDAPMSGKFEYAAVEICRGWHRVYLALGSSEGDRDAYLDFAVDSLKSDSNFKNVKESKRIVSAPYGGVAKGEFVNSAVECDTLYDAKKLLNAVLDIERRGGRERKERWGDRTLDIDILFYDDEIIGDADLCVPHPDMANREFVLIPLSQLCPNKVHPITKKRVYEMLAQLIGQ